MNPSGTLEPLQNCPHLSFQGRSDPPPLPPRPVRLRRWPLQSNVLVWALLRALTAPLRQRQRPDKRPSAGNSSSGKRSVPGLIRRQPNCTAHGATFPVEPGCLLRARCQILPTRPGSANYCPAGPLPPHQQAAIPRKSPGYLCCAIGSGLLAIVSVAPDSRPSPAAEYAPLAASLIARSPSKAY